MRKLWHTFALYIFSKEISNWLTFLINRSISAYYRFVKNYLFEIVYQEYGLHSLQNGSKRRTQKAGFALYRS